MKLGLHVGPLIWALLVWPALAQPPVRTNARSETIDNLRRLPSWPEEPTIIVMRHQEKAVEKTTQTPQLQEATKSKELRLSPRELPAEEFPRSKPTWWDEQVRDRILPDSDPVHVALESLLVSALEHSAQIDIVKDLPLIRETSIVEADAAFDWTKFVESRWNDINDPVGSLLVTNASRYSDQNVTASMGLRRRNELGGELEVAQQFGHQTTNSPFFTPPDQGTSRLTLNYTHPLLRGAGRAYNTSVIVLAKIDAGVANDEFLRQLQVQLVEITRAYWDLHLQRGALLQRRRLYENALAIQNTLRLREQLDSMQGQIVRADAAVARRWSDIQRAEAGVRNAESRIRALVNDPALGESGLSELIPTEAPLHEPYPIELRDGVATAMRNRPEIDQTMRQIKAAGVRCQMSKNELLPLLNVVLETYASGLRGNSNVADAFVDQFDEGTPSYSIGLQYELPVGNRAAQARHQRRRLEYRQIQSQFRATVEMLKLEVEIAGREVTTAYNEIGSKFAAIQAAATEVNYLQDRWELLPGDDRAASLMLEDLLDAQQRLAVTEFEYLDALRSYNTAQTVYKQATGTLLQSERISFDRYCECQLPTINVRGDRMRDGQEASGVSIDANHNGTQKSN